MPKPLLVLVTTADEDSAASLARQLVAEHLIGCANLMPVRRSIYMWKGEVCEDPEVLLVMESTEARFASLEARISELHAYDVPKIVALPITAAHEPYLQWLYAHVEPPTP
jgi:periplasmic divalent cation tolerance protein